MNHPDQPAEVRPLPRILVVEDEHPMRTVLRDVLERQGYRVLLAEDGAAALEIALREQPDLIVLDIMMPHSATMRTNLAGSAPSIAADTDSRVRSSSDDLPHRGRQY